MDVDEPPSKSARSETANLSSYDTVPTFLRGRLEAPKDKQAAGPIVPILRRRDSEKEKEREREREAENFWRDRIASRPAIERRPRFLERDSYMERERSWSPEYATRSRSRSRERVSSFPSRQRAGLEFASTYLERSRAKRAVSPPRFSSSTNNRTKNRGYYSSDNSDSDEDERPDVRSRERRRRGNESGERRGRRNETERTRNMDDAPYSTNAATGPQEVLSSNRVNAIWDPSQQSDLTIHLKLPVQENLDDKIDEFCRLRRLGDFPSARKFFAQELADQDDNPYVLVQYAEMLLEQGDYATLAKLNGHELFAPGGRLLDSKEGSLLCLYWHMIQVERSRYSPPMPWQSLRGILPALRWLHESLVSTGQNPISSTQIRMLALFLMMTTATVNACIQADWLRRQLSNIFPASFYRRLYIDLLREGRIWDFHDIFIAKLLTDSPEEAIRVFLGSTSDTPSMQAVLDDWTASSGKTNDSLTLLALLDMVLRIGLSPKTMEFANPLALVIMESHPDAMASQIFVQWMFQRVRLALIQCKHEQGGHHERLVAAPGIYLEWDYRVPAYIPVGNENPGWGNVDVPVEYQDLTKSMLSHGKRLGNYHLQAEALGKLIGMSQDPEKELMELCTLQKSVQGDISGYSHTLISSYLVLAAGASADELRKNLREICFNPADCLTTEDKWLASMLLYSMERNAGDADEILSKAFHHSIYLREENLAEFDEKMPELRVKRLKYLRNNINDHVERRQAEYGQLAKYRERAAMDFPEFDELVTEEYIGGYEDAPVVERERVVIERRSSERWEKEKAKEEMKRDEEMKREEEMKRDEERVKELERTLRRIKELRMQKTQEEADKEKKEKREKEVQEERKRALEALESLRTEELLKRKQTAVEELRREEEERRRLEILERAARDEEEKLAAERQRREEVEKRLAQKWHEAHDDPDETKSAPEPRTRGFRRPDSPGSADSLELPDAPDPPGSGRSSPIYKRGRRHKPALRVKRVLVRPVIVQIDRLSPLSSPSASPPGSPRSESGDSNSSDTPSFHGAYRPRQLDPVYEEVSEEDVNGQSHRAYVEELDDSDDPTGPSPGITQAPGATDPKKGKSKRGSDWESYDDGWDSKKGKSKRGGNEEGWGAAWEDLEKKDVGDQALGTAAKETNGHANQQNGKTEDASGEAHAGPSSKGREN
ncbi:hypothetical protein PG990_010490 [Apiospora arundinis]